MGIRIKLLIVEDDEAQLVSWDAKIEFHNAESEKHGFYIEHRKAKSLIEAEKELSNISFDAAIVDIRLEQQGQQGPNDDGNRVLEIILDSELAVTALFSGEAGLAKKPEWRSGVEIFTKAEGGGIDAVMSWLFGQVPMIKQIQFAQKDIKGEMAKLFSRSIWPRWSNWIDDNNQNENKFIEDALTRHITSHIYSTFLEKGNQKVHPEEWYFIPPISDGLRTGDLIKDKGGKIEVVVTPRCDLAREGKNETYQLVECKNVSEKWTELCSEVNNAKDACAENNDPQRNNKFEKKVTVAEENLRKFSQHNQNSSVYHFLPCMRLQDGTSIGPFFVQFDKIRSVIRGAENHELLLKQRFASISPDFLPSLVERLGAFFSRIGTPDYSHPE